MARVGAKAKAAQRKQRHYQRMKWVVGSSWDLVAVASPAIDALKSPTMASAETNEEEPLPPSPPPSPGHELFNQHIKDCQCTSDFRPIARYHPINLV